MPTTDPEYLIRCSDGSEERFRTVSDGSALSRTINRACAFQGMEAVWELFYTGPQVDEILARVTLFADRSMTITEVNI